VWPFVVRRWRWSLNEWRRHLGKGGAKRALHRRVASAARSDPGAASRREAAARLRAAQDREQRVAKALEVTRGLRERQAIAFDVRLARPAPRCAQQARRANSFSASEPFSRSTKSKPGQLAGLT
jgi:hypothetical protein